LGQEGEVAKGVGDHREFKGIGFKERNRNANVARVSGPKTLADVRAITPVVSRFHHHPEALVIPRKGAKAGGVRV